MEKSTAETIVKVYAVLAWISAILSLLAGLALMGLSSLGGLGYMMNGTNPMMGGIFAGLGIVMGVILIAIAIFDAIVGYGLWTHQSWARVAAVVVSVLQLFSFPIGTIIGAIGIWLFGFEETVKKLFR